MARVPKRKRGMAQGPRKGGRLRRKERRAARMKRELPKTRSWSRWYCHVIKRNFYESWSLRCVSDLIYLSYLGRAPSLSDNSTWPIPKINSVLCSRQGSAATVYWCTKSDLGYCRTIIDGLYVQHAAQLNPWAARNASAFLYLPTSTEVGVTANSVPTPTPYRVPPRNGCQFMVLEVSQSRYRWHCMNYWRRRSFLKNPVSIWASRNSARKIIFHIPGLDKG
jgi:hypothetical protein